MGKNEFVCDCNAVHQDAVDTVAAKMPDEGCFTRLSDFFKVLGDNTRIKIVWALDEQELCVCDIANILHMTKSAVSHQLGTLRNANLVKTRRDSKTVYYALADDHVKELLEAGFEHINE